MLILSMVLIIVSSIYFSLKLNFPQLKLFKILKGLKYTNDSNMSPIQGLIISLAARIGVGSISGIAIAINYGGPGTILWILIITILISINTYCESYLGLKYQDNNKYIGGTPYYIEKGLNNKKLARVYALLIIISYIFGFMTIQANTITKSITNIFNINTFIVALIISIISFMSIEKGIKRVTKILDKIVPIMGIIYLIISLFIIISNTYKIPSILSIIIKDAFNINKIFPNSFIATIIISLERSIFSTESGLGTTSYVVSSIKTDNKIDLSLSQIIGVYITVFIVCLSTALIILTSNYNIVLTNNLNGIEIIEHAFNYHLGRYGNYILIIIVILLAYSTIIAGYFYTENSLKYIVKSINNIHLLILKIVISILLLLGSIINSSILWVFVDKLVEVLICVNIYSLLRLRKKIVNDYKK